MSYDGDNNSAGKGPPGDEKKKAAAPATKLKVGNKKKPAPKAKKPKGGKKKEHPENMRLEYTGKIEGRLPGVNGKMKSGRVFEVPWELGLSLKCGEDFRQTTEKLKDGGK